MEIREKNFQDRGILNVVFILNATNVILEAVKGTCVH